VTLLRRPKMLDQASASSKADRASPRRIIDQSPASRPKSRVTAIERGAVPVANPDFLTATDIVFFSLIFVPIFPDAAMLEGTRGHFEPEL
jgi:hypothetical protein